MHQGAMLILESGVILVDEAAALAKQQGRDTSVQMRPGGSNQVQHPGATNAAPPILTRRPGDAQRPADERDEHYERYLREREAMQRSGSAQAPHGAAGGNRVANNATRGNAVRGNAVRGNDQSSAEVDELLKNLGRSRDR